MLFSGFFLQTLLFTAFLVTVLKILTYTLVSTWSLVSSRWENVNEKCTPAYIVAVLGSITLDKCGGEWGYIGADCWCITKGFLLLDQDACNSFNILVGRAHKDANQALLLILQVMGNILYVLIAWCITNPCALSQSQMFMHRRTALPSREHSASIHILAGSGGNIYVRLW